MHESYACKSKAYLTACGISFTQIKNKREPKRDPCVTPQEVFPKSESLLSILIRHIRSKR